jgi:hypothetical protein
MNKTIQNALRWIAVLPCAILAGILATFVLHFILYTTLTKFVTPYPKFPERALVPFVVVVTFIWTGFQVAPNHKLTTALILFSMWIFFAGGFIMSTLTGGKWFGRDLYFQAGGIAPFLGIAGAFVGLFLTWRKNKQQTVITEKEDELIISDTAKKVNFYDKYGTDIFNLIFISFFVLCLFSHTGRIIIFCVLLILNSVKIYLSLKKKEYTTNTMKINLAKGIIMTLLLLMGIFYQEIGFYVSILCLILQAYDSIRYFIAMHLRKKTSTTAQSSRRPHRR